MRETSPDGEAVASKGEGRQEGQEEVDLVDSMTCALGAKTCARGTAAFSVSVVRQGIKS